MDFMRAIYVALLIETEAAILTLLIMHLVGLL
jgi:hypothetical protein